MAFEVTATRKRPQNFETLIGQQFVVSTLKSAIEQKRIAHAYLFSGPRGVGKTSLARIVAKALNCEEGPSANPCGVCSNCKAITAGSSADVIEIDGASNTSVNDVRIIKDEILFPPTASLYKIYIIDEVHMLSNSAFNALLKTIEEPPEYVIFIFATTETQKVPPTIRSRCQQFHFQLIDLATIKSALTNTVKEMEIKAEEDALFWIAKEATGSLRDAYTLFDQIVSFSDGNITMALIEEKLGLAGSDKISAIFLPLVKGEREIALKALWSLLDSGVSVEQTIKELTGYVRVLLLVKAGVTNESILNMQVNRIPQELLNAFSSEQLEAALELFLQLYRDIRYSLSGRFELELAVSRLTNLKNMASSYELVNKIEEFKNELLEGQIEIKAQQTAAVEKPIKVKKEEVVVQPKKGTLTKEILTEMIQKLAAERDTVGMVLSQLVEFNHSENGLELLFASKYMLDTATQNRDKIASLILKYSGYEGPITFERFKEIKKEKPKEPPNKVAQEIATLFRGELIT
jgi:DNA polymerase-3 subunit gamma/tau